MIFIFYTFWNILRKLQNHLRSFHHYLWRWEMSSPEVFLKIWKKKKNHKGLAEWKQDRELCSRVMLTFARLSITMLAICGHALSGCSVHSASFKCGFLPWLCPWRVFNTLEYTPVTVVCGDRYVMAHCFSIIVKNNVTITLPVVTISALTVAFLGDSEEKLSSIFKHFELSPYDLGQNRLPINFLWHIVSFKCWFFKSKSKISMQCTVRCVSFPFYRMRKGNFHIFERLPRSH